VAANPSVQPYAPDPAAVPGTPPVAGTGGERGTSAFPGNADFDHLGRRRANSTAAPGPKLGTAYYTGGVSPEGVTAAPGARESAGTHAASGVTSLAVTADDATPAADAAVVLTATATDAEDAVPTGTVTFKDGAATLGTGTFNGSGVATYTVSGGFTAGAHSITAVYAGDANFAATTSPALTVTAS
jgi:hypothetical protein